MLKQTLAKETCQQSGGHIDDDDKRSAEESIQLRGKHQLVINCGTTARVAVPGYGRIAGPVIVGTRQGIRGSGSGDSEIE